MGSAASQVLDPTAAELDGPGSRPTAPALARRALQRRQIQGMIGVSYAIDTLILLLYAQAGAITFLLAFAYAACGLTIITISAILSEFGFNERFTDHYLIPQNTIANTAVMLAFAFIAPQLGVMFLCVLFIVFSFSSLRATPRQTMTTWTAMTLGVAVLLLLTATPISIPHDTYLERFATMMVFVLTIGRCTFVGILSSSMKQSLYRSGKKLKEAYRRIEELAELDELTGAFNRRCIMRMLDEEIARTRRNGTSCSIALIDLDWFKRINDAYGHPTGDEVLRTFAITMFANVRSNDRFGRYGGEEFLLLLPDLSDDGAIRALDRLRAIIADLDWSAFSPGMKVTISAGVATLRPNDSADTLLARADSALYAAKAGGRNRVSRT